MDFNKAFNSTFYTRLSRFSSKLPGLDFWAGLCLNDIQIVIFKIKSKDNILRKPPKKEIYKISSKEGENGHTKSKKKWLSGPGWTVQHFSFPWGFPHVVGHFPRTLLNWLSAESCLGWHTANERAYFNRRKLLHWPAEKGCHGAFKWTNQIQTLFLNEQGAV